MTSKAQLVLIDGHALAYRMFFALPELATRSGEPTNAVRGFTQTILNLINAPTPPDYLAVSFDLGATFRDELFPEYKGTRDKMPDTLRSQITRIQEVLDALKIPILTADGFEADDVLGTIGHRVGEQGIDVLIITGDRDLLQLVDKQVIVQLPGTKSGEVVQYDPAAVEAKYGVTPEQFVDYKALIGDNSDNIPGVAGIGEKTAVKLLQAYQTLDAIYENLDQIVEKRARSALEHGREMAYLSQKLSRIVTDVSMEFDLEACRIRDYDLERVVALFRELEFRTFLKLLPGAEGLDTGPSDGQQLSLFDSPASGSPSKSITPAAQIGVTHIVDTEDALNELVNKLESASGIAFDTETTGTDQMSADLVGISLSVQSGEGYYIPVGHTYPEAVQLPLERVIQSLQAPMTNPAIPKYGHNIKYDAVVLARYGLQVSPLAFDTMVGEWLTRPDASRGKLGLKSMGFDRFGVQMTEISELIGTGKKQITMDKVTIDRAAPYAVADADITYRLVEPIQQELQAHGLNRLFEEVEMPLVDVLMDMEMTGVLVDVDLLRRLSSETGETLGQLRGKIVEIAGYDFNLNSTQQLSQALFERLRLPTQGMRKTAAGFYSTAADVLDTLKEHDTSGVIDALIQYRELEKLRSTYLDALPVLVNSRTGRIHTSYNQSGAVTGRLSSSDPNLQNIPIRSDAGRKIRDAFIADPGNMLIAADYSQIELRILAHVSGDPNLQQAFREDQDIHASTAATVYGIPFEQVTRSQRNFAKAVNFGLMYGMGAYRLARDSNLTLAEAEAFIKAYFERFAKVKEYLDGSKTLAAEQGYLETLLKRRRYFPALQSKDTSRDAEIKRRAAEREAINMPIQGTAADIIKLAMINLHKALVKEQLSAKMILQVHDELVVEAPEELADETAALVKQVMENAYTLNVTLKVDTHIARNWGEAK
jgi:DNA polymerase-1